MEKNGMTLEFDLNLDVRSETSVSSCTYSDGSFVGLFYTSKWGDFTKACSRITGFKPTEYRKATTEAETEYAIRIKKLEQYLNKSFSHLATFKLNYQNYRIETYDSNLLDASYAVRPPYRPRPKKDSDSSNLS